MSKKLNIDLRAISLKQFRTFATVVREGAYSRAAKVLNLTPPAITFQMQQLEESVGMPLIERTDKGLRVTDGGHEILAAAGRIDAVLSECSENLEALSGIEGGKVTVGIVSTAKYFAPRALAEFVKDHPNVDVRLMVGNREETIATMRNYDLDLAVMGRPPEDFEIDSEIIGDHPHIVIGPPGHPKMNRKDIPLMELAEETFLLREQGSGTRLLMERLFMAAGANPRTGMEIGSNETIKQAVMAGLGVALLSAHTVAAELQEGRLIKFDVHELPVIRQWFVVKRQDKRVMPSAQALWDFLASSGHDHFP